MRNNWYYWMIGGALVGAAVVGLGQMNNRKMRMFRRNAACMARHLTREAGSALCSMGESIARKIR